MFDFSDRMRLILVFGLITLLLPVSCHRNVPYAPDHPVRIAFGSYGGFAGTYKEFVLLPNGQLFVRKRLRAQFDELQSLDPAITKQLFTVVRNFRKQGMVQEGSGNLTNFISFEEIGHPPLQWSWESGTDVDDRIRRLFRNLNVLCKESPPVM